MVLESILLSVVDQELKVEIGLDSGKGSCKVFMSIEENNKNILGTGEMSPPPKKSKKEGKWKNKHKDRGVKKLFVIGLVRNISETYGNFKILLNLPGIQLFSFIFDHIWLAPRHILNVPTLVVT